MAGPNMKGDSNVSEANNSANVAGLDTRQFLSESAFASQQKQDAAPTGIGKVASFTGYAIEHLPAGIYNAVKEDVQHPWDTVKMLGTSVGFGAVMKAALPEGSATGAITGALIGGYFLWQNKDPFVKSIQDAAAAKTNEQLKSSANEFADASGSFGVNGLASIYAAKFGARGMGRVLNTEAMDGFAEGKAKFWGSLDNGLGKALKPLGIGTAGSIEMQPRFKVENGKAILEDTNKAAAKGEVTGEVDPNAPMRVSVYLKGQDFKLDRRIARIDAGKAGYVTDQEFATKFAPKPESVQKFQDYAKQHGLTVENYDPRTGRAQVAGTAKQMQDAFMGGDTLKQVQRTDGIVHRGREGKLVLSDPSLAPHIDGILGMDNRPAFKPQSTGFTPLDQLNGGSVPADGAVNTLRAKPILASDLAQARNMPSQFQGEGMNVGIGELGGDLNLQDNAKFYQQHAMEQPNIRKVALDGVDIQSDGPNGADGEVALDTVNVGLAAPKAGQTIAWGNNDDTGIADVTNRLAFPEKGEPQNASISWSWGQNEPGWTQQSIRVTDNAFKKAYAKGIGVFAASGDDGASDRAAGGKKAVDYPASSPYVTGVGGTQTIIDAHGVPHDVTWNDGAMGGAGGGGRSEVFQRPDFQQGLDMPPNANGSSFDGRGVPDVSENASPKSGYIVRVDGQTGAIGGTSGAAPMWAAYAARWSQALGRNIGNINQFAYKYGTQGIFNDVISGNNDGYSAGPGWDAATGWGPPKGQAFLDMLKKDAANHNKVRGMVAPVQVDSNANNKQNAG